MDKIPHDILIEILSKLPLKSLTGFKIVSKEWHYVITNSVPVPDNPMALVRRARSGSLSKFYCINHRGDEEIVSFPRKRNRDFRIYNSCQGLLLVQIYRELFVWNPLTKFIKKVLICDALEDTYCWGIAGLCYDNLVNKYKVVVTTYLMSCIDQAFLVATCGSDKFEQFSFPTKIDEVKSGPNFRGHIHWYYSKVDLSGLFPHQQIVYFDSQENQFVEIPTPQSKEGDIDLIIGLGVFDGCLSITRSTNLRKFQGRLELSAMKEYGVGNSWAVMLIISDPICKPCGFAVLVCKRKDSGAMVCVYNMGGWGMNVYDASGNSVRPIYEFDNYDLVAYEECVTSPVDELYWNDVEENLCRISRASVT